MGSEHRGQRLAGMDGAVRQHQSQSPCNQQNRAQTQPKAQPAAVAAGLRFIVHFGCLLTSVGIERRWAGEGFIPKSKISDTGSGATSFVEKRAWAPPHRTKSPFFSHP